MQAMKRGILAPANFLPLQALSLVIVPANAAPAHQERVDKDLVTLQVDADPQHGVRPAASSLKFLREMAVAPIKRKIESFRAYQEDWDGPGTIQPDKETIDAALLFVESLSLSSELPSVSAGGDGELSIFWRDDDKFVDVSFHGQEASAYSRVDGKIDKVRSLRHFYDLPHAAVEALTAA